MKFERWNEEKKQFELVKMTPDEYEELLVNFSIIDAESQIEDRIELLKSFQPEMLENLKKIPKYD
tara:strand:- start:3372 stop:3566 length:195 start_codon:yes stop_codon:yes gene_type:complete